MRCLSADVQCPGYVQCLWALSRSHLGTASGLQEHGKAIYSSHGLSIYFTCLWLLDGFLLYARRYSGKEIVPCFIYSWKTRIFRGKAISGKAHPSLSLNLPPYFFPQLVLCPYACLPGFMIETSFLIRLFTPKNMCGVLAVCQALG